MGLSITQKASSWDTFTSVPQWNHDVFLSFKGIDTRNNFTDHLYAALIRRHIRTFRDDKLKRGEGIAPELSLAIQESRIAVVVFSENYANSKWCLEELAKIMECKKERGQTVLPIFYHVEPSVLRKQTGSFGDAIAYYEKSMDKEMVQRWRVALREACNLSGWHVHDRYESEYIKEITESIFIRLNHEPLHVGKNLVGMSLHLKEMESLLSIESNDVSMVGIYGCGGIGKTTIAKVVYNLMSCQYEGSSFLANVRESSKDRLGLLELQKVLLHDILGGDHDISNVDRGINVIRNTLRSKRVLVIVDDANHLSQLESLVGSREWFGQGSRIVITTRDKHLLALHDIDKLYEVKELNSQDAIELFSWNAFKQKCPKEDYVNISECVVEYAKGLPLALKVLGSCLFGKTLSQWESALDKLKKKSNNEIQDVLRISFDELDDMEKDIFLDVACFFQGQDEEFVIRTLDGCGFYAKNGLGVLSDKCLITISCNKIYMHDLLQEMGRDIVREVCPKDPGKWSRLWEAEDIYHVLSRNKGTEAIEGIFFDMSTLNKIKITAQAFKKMDGLRLLKVHQGFKYDSMENKYDSVHKEYDPEKKIYRVNERYRVELPEVLHLSEGFQFPSYELKYLHWDGYSLEYLPSNFQAENLVELTLRCSSIRQPWKGNKLYEKLKVINFSHSKHLTEIPTFSSVPNLEKLILKGCESLESLPSDISKMKNLKTLICSGCSKLGSFPDIADDMESLKELYLDSTAMKELPSSIGRLKGLEYFILSGCGELVSLPDSIRDLRSLKYLSVEFCSNLNKFPQIRGTLQCLEKLVIADFSSELPSLLGLCSLTAVSLSGCNQIQGPILSDIFCLKSLVQLDLRNCNLMEGGIPSEICHLKSLEELNLSYNHFSSIPSCINQLPKLRSLLLGHCKMLLQLPELPSSLRCLDAHDCPCLETSPSPSSQLGFSLFKCFKSEIQKFERGNRWKCSYLYHTRYLGEGIGVVFPGSGGIPDWMRHQKRGCEVTIDLPVNWYEDRELLGFAICAVYDLSDYESESHEYLFPYHLRCDLSLHLGGDVHFADLLILGSACKCYYIGGVSDQVWLMYYPKVAVNEMMHPKLWTHLQASFKGFYNYYKPFRVKECGMQAIYAQDLEHHHVIDDYPLA